MTDSKPVASVVILTKNGRPDIDHCLEAVFSQDTGWPFEVIVVDSGSTDGTLDLVRSFPVRLKEIPPASFNHGGTRNLGAEMARGRFIAFLTQDAVPADTHWLSALVAAVDGEGVGGALSRQLPTVGAHALSKRSLDLWVAGQDRRVVKRMPDPETYAQLPPHERYLLAVFDNVSSCMRKTAWEKLPFRQVPFGEDLDWGQRALEAGYALIYEPASRVVHSHNRSALYELKRIYLDHQNLYAMFGLESVPTLRAVLRGLFRGWAGLGLYVLASGSALGEKLYLLLCHIPFLVPAQVFGQYLGRHASDFRARFKWFGRVDQWLRRGV